MIDDHDGQFDIIPITEGVHSDLGWYEAICIRCDERSGNNAEPYTEEWVETHTCATTERMAGMTDCACKGEFADGNGWTSIHRESSCTHQYNHAEYVPPIRWHRILITGSRDFADQPTIHNALDERLMEHGFITIIQGECEGADLAAKAWAQKQILRGMREGLAYVRLESYAALWDEFDKSAGPIRNKYMVQLGADECLAFSLPQSRGTIGCMKLAQAAGIPVTNLGTLPEGTLFR